MGVWDRGAENGKEQIDIFCDSQVVLQRVLCLEITESLRDAPTSLGLPHEPGSGLVRAIAADEASFRWEFSCANVRRRFPARFSALRQVAWRRACLLPLIVLQIVKHQPHGFPVRESPSPPARYSSVANPSWRLHLLRASVL